MATQRVAPDRRRRAPAIGTRHFLTLAAEMSCAPGPGGRVCKLAAPRGSAPGPGKEHRRQSFPGLPPCRPPAVLRAAPRAASREPRAPGAAAAERFRTPPPPRKANFSAGALYLFGGFAAAQPAVSAAHPPPGAPGRRLPTPGPPEAPCRPGPAARSVPAGRGCRRDPETEPGSADLSRSWGGRAPYIPEEQGLEKPAGFAAPLRR